MSVFERIVYHSWAVDTSNPCRPTLEVDAVVREGDADRALLLPIADYILMVGGPEAARPCLDRLAAQGRIVRHLDVDHIEFPFWTPIDISGPPPPGTELRHDPPLPPG